MMKKLHIISIATSLLLLSASNAQSFEEFKQTQQKSFKKFKDERDKAFTEYLTKGWKEFVSNQGLSPLEPKPKVMPKTKPTKVIIPKEKEIKIAPIAPVVQKKIKKPVYEKVKKLPSNTNIIKVPFYGYKLKYTYDKNMLFKMSSNINEKGISEAWKALSVSEYKPLLAQIRNTQKGLLLNDWGMYLFLQNLGKGMYINEAQASIFTWFFMTKLGYNIKVGFNAKDVAILAPAKKVMYSTTYYTLGGMRYYALDTYAGRKKLGKIFTYEQNYPRAEAKLDFSIEQMPNLRELKQTKKLSFTYDKQKHILNIPYNASLVQFFEDYPQVAYEHYFNAPVSFESKKNLVTQLKPILEGKGEVEAVNILLRFVQNAFAYKVDEAQFNHEKVMLPDETLYYKYSDCEDRAILFAFLVKEILGLDVVGLKYPQHMATAVALKQNIKGDSLQYKGKKYLVADPTYINANIGMTMPQVAGKKIEVIAIN